MDRVEFFPINDFMCGHWHKRLIDIVKNHDSEKQDYDVNDVIEFYNIILYKRIISYLLNGRKMK